MSPCETCRQTVERESNDLNKTWSDMKQLARSRVPWRVGVVDVPVGIKEIKKEKNVIFENHIQNYDFPNDVFKI